MLFIGDLKMAPEGVIVSIVIRTKNEEKQLGLVLRKIASQDYSGSYEIIIVDSGSTDKTVQIAAEFGARLYRLDKEPFSYGYALNYGQRLACGQVIVFLSAHCLPADSFWLRNLVAPLTGSRPASAAYGKQLPVRGVNPVEEFELEIFFPEQDRDPKAVFSNANCAITREILQEYPFNEEIAYGEDFLWRKKLPPGIRVVYAPNARVYHSHPGTLRYWAGHHKGVGMATVYLQKVEGIDNFYGRKGSRLKQLLSRLAYPLFFLKQGYLKAFFTFPAIELTRSIYFFRGLVAGKRKYGGLKSGIATKNV
jgi:glycosyltransferase involved in cell wall biosynthesis